MAVSQMPATFHRQNLTGFQAKASDAQRELDKRSSYTSLRPNLEVYVPVLNRAKEMCALKTPASDVLLIGSYFLSDKNQGVKLF